MRVDVCIIKRKVQQIFCLCALSCAVSMGQSKPSCLIPLIGDAGLYLQSQDMQNWYAADTNTLSRMPQLQIYPNGIFRIQKPGRDDKPLTLEGVWKTYSDTLWFTSSGKSPFRNSAWHIEKCMLHVVWQQSEK